MHLLAQRTPLHRRPAPLAVWTDNTSVILAALAVVLACSCVYLAVDYQGKHPAPSVITALLDDRG